MSSETTFDKFRNWLGEVIFHLSLRIMSPARRWHHEVIIRKGEESIQYEAAYASDTFEELV